MRQTIKEDGFRLSLPENKENSAKHDLWFLFPAILLVLTALLLLVPAARKGLEALCNMLFDASEAVNRYVYQRFSVPPETPTAMAAIILGMMGIGWIGFVFVCPNAFPALLSILIISVGQAYFGLALPWWILIPFYGLIALRMMQWKTWGKAAAFCLAVTVLAVGIAAVWPGVDEATEAASERVRDALGRPAAAATGGGGEAEDAAFRETRHVNSQSLLEGGGQASPAQSYRLVTVEEQQISMPHWIDYLKIGLLLLLAVAALVLPFLPFAALNARRKKALEARAAFDVEDTSCAVCAMFRHVMRYLEFSGAGASNALFRSRAEALSRDLSEDYRARCLRCVPLFEEAAYSDHALPEGSREEVKALLDETEALFYDRAGLRQRLRLRYGECLHL